jgi:hypothetical protein
MNVTNKSNYLSSVPAGGYAISVLKLNKSDPKKKAV